MHNLIITEDAYLDIEGAFSFYELQREGLGFDFELCLEAGLNSIVRGPGICQVRYKNIRVCFIDKFPFGIHFLSDSFIVTVVAVFHTSQNPKKWLKRTHKA